MRRAAGILIATILAMSGGEAAAVPVLAIDTDPGTDGIQSERTVTLGSALSIDVLVFDVDAADPLNAFEFEVDLDALVATATGVVDGGFLGGPVFPLQEIVTPGSVFFSGVTLGPTGVAGAGILARIDLSAVGLGTTSLVLDRVILSAPGGREILAPGLQNGVLNVVAPVSPIPEPGAGLAFALGLGALALGLRAAA